LVSNENPGSPGFFVVSSGAVTLFLRRRQTVRPAILGMSFASS